MKTKNGPFHVSDNKGFSMVEIVIVVTILLAVVGLTYPTFTKVLEKQRAIEGVGILNSMKSAVSIFELEGGTGDIDLVMLDVEFPTPDYFTIPAVTCTGTPYQCQVVRPGLYNLCIMADTGDVTCRDLNGTDQISCLGLGYPDDPGC